MGELPRPPKLSEADFLRLTIAHEPTPQAETGSVHAHFDTSGIMWLIERGAGEWTRRPVWGFSRVTLPG